MSGTLRFGAPLLPAGGFHFGDRGGGLLVENLPVGGQDGESILRQWTSPADNGSEVRLVIDSMPLGLTAFFGEDGAAIASAPDGTYIGYGHLEKDYATSGGSQPISFTFGDGILSIAIVEQTETVAAAVSTGATAAVSIAEQAETVTANIAVAATAVVGITEQSEAVAAVVAVAVPAVTAALGVVEQTETISMHALNGTGIQVPASRTVRFAGENRTVRF